MNKTQFQNLNLSNAFLFAAAMTEPENCRLMLEMILGREISDAGSLKVHTEHMVFFNTDYKSVRLDVYISENSAESEVEYDVEMQASAEGAIAQRSRYYQAVMDATTYRRGSYYGQMKPNYVIFICTYDPFHRGLYRYSYENLCKEDGYPLEDGTYKIFLNTKGRNPEDVPKELVAFLQYVEDSSQACAETLGSSQIRQLNDNIMQLKRDHTWEDRFMTVGELIEDEAKKAEQRMLALIKYLMRDGRQADLDRLMGDEDPSTEYLEGLYQEYNL